jgi:hypothetical protein
MGVELLASVFATLLVLAAVYACLLKKIRDFQVTLPGRIFFGVLGIFTVLDLPSDIVYAITADYSNEPHLRWWLWIIIVANVTLTLIYSCAT